MCELKFENVADVNFTYPYICIYKKNNINPFMDIGIDEEKQITFKIYSNNVDIDLTLNDWKKIMEKALEFYPKAIKNEEDYQKYFVEHQNPD